MAAGRVINQLPATPGNQQLASLALDDETAEGKKWPGVEQETGVEELIKEITQENRSHYTNITNIVVIYETNILGNLGPCCTKQENTLVLVF